MDGSIRLRFLEERMAVFERMAGHHAYVLCISSYNGNVSYRIAFGLGAEVTGITLDPPSIVFTG